MTLASPAQPVPADQGGSSSTKQMLYLVAFASFGLLISVQFRHLFVRPGVAATPSSTAPSVQPSPGDERRTDGTKAAAKTPPALAPAVAEEREPNADSAAPADNGAAASSGDVLVVERTVTLEHDPDTQPDTAAAVDQPTAEESSAVRAAETNTQDDSAVTRVPRNGAPESVALFFAALRAPQSDDAPAATAGDSFSPADLKRFLVIENEHEQGLDAATAETHHHDGQALAHLFGFQAVDETTDQAGELAPLTAEQVADWTQFLTQLKSAAAHGTNDSAAPAHEAAPTPADASVAQSEPAESSPPLAATNDVDKPRTADEAGNDELPPQPQAELPTPANAILAPADDGANNEKPAAAQAVDEVVLVNPADSGGTILYLVEGRAFALAPGQAHRLPADRPWRIAFHRGDDFGDAELLLDKGEFRFAVGPQGWQLLPQGDAK